MKKIKIFIVATELPARIGGSCIRNFNLIKQLPKDIFSVSLFTIIDDETKKFLSDVKNELNIPIYPITYKGFSLMKQLYASIIKRVIPYMEEYRVSGIANVLLNKINEEHPDIIQLEQINAYYAIKDIIPFIKEKNIKIILDAHNVEQVAFKESLKIFPLIKRAIGKWILPNFAKIENNVAKSVEHIFTCSDTDKAHFADIVNTEIITVIPNGTDTVFFRSEKTVLENTLLFMGGVYYPPNEEALRYYFSDIHPSLKKLISDIKIYVLCGKPPKWISQIMANDNSVIAPGFVVDVREYLNKAKVCITPIKSGSGTRLKVLEYMSMGKPVVSTSKGAEGLDVKNNRNILIADHPDDFLGKIIRLMRNPKEAAMIGKEARRLVEKKYDWKIITKKAQVVYLKLKT
jgi:polysaccharide biosynthesis protein PslH